MIITLEVGRKYLIKSTSSDLYHEIEIIKFRGQLLCFDLPHDKSGFRTWVKFESSEKSNPRIFWQSLEFEVIDQLSGPNATESETHENL